MQFGEEVPVVVPCSDVEAEDISGPCSLGNEHVPGDEALATPSLLVRQQGPGNVHALNLCADGFPGVPQGMQGRR